MTVKGNPVRKRGFRPLAGKLRAKTGVVGAGTCRVDGFPSPCGEIKGQNIILAR